MQPALVLTATQGTAETLDQWAARLAAAADDVARRANEARAIINTPVTFTTPTPYQPAQVGVSAPSTWKTVAWIVGGVVLVRWLLR